MADTMQFDLVSPERMLASVQAAEVLIPGAEGDLTAMPEHMPVITTLRPGLLRVTGPEGTQEYVVSGGFAEITATSASVLAERALPREDVTQEFMEDLRREAEAVRDRLPEEEKDAAEKILADLTHLAEDMV